MYSNMGIKKTMAVLAMAAFSWLLVIGAFYMARKLCQAVVAAF
jgi:hypothetical protein